MNVKLSEAAIVSSDKPRPTFCTLFTIRSIHLTKELGLIPYGMYKFEEYDSFITTYGDEDLPNLKYLPGLNVERVPKISGDWVKDSCLWLKANAKRIDVLNIIHLSGRSFRHALTYKLHNPYGKIYLKMDGIPKGHKFKLWKNIKPFITLKMCSLASTEFEENTQWLSKRWHSRVICVPNPFSPNELQDFRPFSERHNTILTVGRLGTRQKATEILLEAFAKIHALIPNWTLKLAGRFEENLNIAKDFYASHPELRERVIFTGEVIDRQELMELYRDAKIFAFPSRWESFGIALAEAMMHGCFPVVTKIDASQYLTDNFKFALGSEVDDVDGLAQNLLYACTHQDEAERLALEGREQTMRRCDLQMISRTIADGLK